MEIQKNFNLKNYNTFGIDINTSFFVNLVSLEDLKKLIQTEIFKNNKKLFLGGGSNILFTEDFQGLVVLNNIKGIQILKEDDNFVYLKSFAGENWNDLVDFTVEKNFWGIENLAQIPGTVGASPVQNIGAYGVEIKDTLEEVYAIDIDNGEEKIFKNSECKFGYRDSIFKNELKGKYFIYAISLKLSKKPEININYKALKDYISLNKLKIEKAKDISEIVSKIRASKLPDPKILGNAGSFFKNTYVSKAKLDELIKSYPNMPFFEEGGDFKIPTAWLIESCGFKGEIFENVGVYKDQALILVNYGGATGEEVKLLAEKIIKEVFKKFDIKINPEVNIL